MSIAESLMVDVLARLQSSVPVIADTTMIRRTHRTVVTRELAPAAHVVDGTDTPSGNVASDCRVEREKRFTVSGFFRNDDGYAEADAFVVAVMAKLNPFVTGYGSGVRLIAGPITYELEIADTDALRIDMDFTFNYQAFGWSLTVPA